MLIFKVCSHVYDSTNWNSGVVGSKKKRSNNVAFKIIKEKKKEKLRIK